MSRENTLRKRIREYRRKLKDCEKQIKSLERTNVWFKMKIREWEQELSDLHNRRK